MIVAKGFGTDQRIVLRGYGGVTTVSSLREVVRLVSEINMRIEVTSNYDF